MSFRRSALILVSAALATGCGGGQHPEPVARRGRIERNSNFIEAVGRNRIRVVAFDFGGVELGQCTTPEGDLRSKMCVPASDNVSRDGKLEKEDVSTLSSLNSGMFRQYSLRTDNSGSVKISVPSPVEGKADIKISISRHMLVFEWRRYVLESLSEKLSKWPFLELLRREALEDQEPYVSALERGVAVRVVFNVSLRSTDANAALSFGFGSLATALARSEAEVEVGYELIGTTMDILPERATNITSVDGYIDAMTRFYDAVRRISTAWECVDREAMKDRLSKEPVLISYQPACDNNGTLTQAGRDAGTFAPGILAYYVTGVRSDRLEEAAAYSHGYVAAIEGTRDKKTCANITDSKNSKDTSDESLEKSFRAGVEQALTDIRGGGGWCSTTKKDNGKAPADEPPTAADVRRAKEMPTFR